MSDFDIIGKLQVICLLIFIYTICKQIHYHVYDKPVHEKICHTLKLKGVAFDSMMHKLKNK